jgi:hypothetical protein
VTAELTAAARVAAMLLHQVAHYAPYWMDDGHDYRVDPAVFEQAATELDRLTQGAAE